MDLAPPPTGRLLVKREGHSITRQIPKPVVLVDTREQRPFEFSRHCPARRLHVGYDEPYWFN
jgi:hypothetical protein